MQRTADFHDQITDARLSEATGGVDKAATRDTAVDILDTHTSARDTPIRGLLRARQSAATWLSGWHDHRDLIKCARQAAQILEQSAAAGQGEGVAPAIRLSWVLPAQVSRSKKRDETRR